MKSSLENLYVDIEAWRVSKVEDDSADEFTKQSNNSFHRTYVLARDPRLFWEGERPWVSTSFSVS